MAEPVADEHPLVSSIMLVGYMSIKDILAGIRCFQEQTYPNKELIIVNNAKTQFAASELNIRAEKDVFLVDTPECVPAGQARNFGITAANGRILAQFDANYWFDKDRLSLQISSLIQHEAHVSVLPSVLNYSYASGIASIFTSPGKVVFGTMVFIRPRDIDYPPTIKGEEYGILQKLSQAKFKIISVDKPELACRLCLTLREEVLKIAEERGLQKGQSAIIRAMIKARRKWATS